MRDTRELIPNFPDVISMILSAVVRVLFGRTMLDMLVDALTLSCLSPASVIAQDSPRQKKHIYSLHKSEDSLPFHHLNIKFSLLTMAHRAFTFYPFDFTNISSLHVLLASLVVPVCSHCTRAMHRPQRVFYTCTF